VRGADHMLSEKSQWTENGTMFVDLDLLLNASSPLSASAELLVNCTKHSSVVDHWGLYRKRAKKLKVVAEIFFAKSAETCFTPLTEIKHNSVSLR